MKAYGNKIHMAVSSMEGVSNLIYDIQSKTTEEFPEEIAGDLTFFKRWKGNFSRWERESDRYSEYTYFSYKICERWFDCEW